MFSSYINFSHIEPSTKKKYTSKPTAGIPKRSIPAIAGITQGEAIEDTTLISSKSVRLPQICRKAESDRILTLVTEYTNIVNAARRCC